MFLQVKTSTSAQPVVLRRRRQHVKIEANWDWFYYQFEQVCLLAHAWRWMPSQARQPGFGCRLGWSLVDGVEFELDWAA